MLNDQGWIGITDAMGRAGLLVGWRHGPDLTVWASNCLCNGPQNNKPRGIYAIVIGNQNAHLILAYTPPFRPVV
jgi:hypothetical protein